MRHSTRREFVKAIGLAAAMTPLMSLTALAGDYEEGYATAEDGAKLYFRVYGNPDGPNLFMGPHFYASQRLTSLEDEGLKDPTDQWIEGLADKYRLILADYPRGTGNTGDALGLEFTPDIAVRDYLSIADAVGAKQFAWIGYSYGGAMGVQMACRTNRVSALMIGGFPPLNAPFWKMVKVTEDLAANPPAAFAQMEIDEKVWLQSVGFYRPLLTWPEREEVSKLTMPRMVFIGENDFGQGLDPKYMTALAQPIRSTETELRTLGWEIHWISGAGHLDAIKPEVALPIVRTFLGKVL